MVIYIYIHTHTHMHVFNSFPKESLCSSQHGSSDSLMNRNGRELARAVCTPSGGATCWDHVKHPAFAPGIPESAFGLFKDKWW